MFWGMKIDKPTQINGQLILTNLCGMGRVKLDGILIATLNQQCPQLQIDLKLNGQHTLSCDGGSVDVCGYYADPKSVQYEELSNKAQNLQSEEEMKKLFHEELKNIKRALKQK